MKLLLTSSGLTNKSIINALLDLSKKPFNELYLAFIPTAANVETGSKDWLINDYVNCLNCGFKSIDIVDISALAKDIWLPRLETADILLFGGGNNFHLMNWIKKSGLKELLSKLLETRVFVGISAGRMVACKNLDLCTSEKLYEEIPDKDDKDESLGYIDFLVRPHLNSPHFPNVNLIKLEEFSKEYPDQFYAIDDNTAIKVDDHEISVISEGVWKKFN